MKENYKKKIVFESFRTVFKFIKIYKINYIFIFWSPIKIFK